MASKRILASLKTPPEEIIQRDHLATALNAERMLRDHKFIVRLACLHWVYTGATGMAVCPRCTEMLKRSITDGTEDYEGYRAGRVRDTMAWKEDPCRQLNEPADLQGNFRRE